MRRGGKQVHSASIRSFSVDNKQRFHSVPNLPRFELPNYTSWEGMTSIWLICWVDSLVRQHCLVCSWNCSWKDLSKSHSGSSRPTIRAKAPSLAFMPPFHLNSIKQTDFISRKLQQTRFLERSQNILVPAIFRVMEPRGRCVSAEEIQTRCWGC